MWQDFEAGRSFSPLMDKFALENLQVVHVHQNSRFVSPVNAHDLLFEHYFFIFQLVRSVLQAVSASQIAFSLCPCRPKHLLILWIKFNGNL